MLDFETQNNTEGILQKKGNSGLYPFKGDRICGAAISSLDSDKTYYVPVRHRGGKNIPVEAFQRWLADQIHGPGQWINHNVVFDSIFARFDNAVFGRDLVCTLTMSKIHDSDRVGHGLKKLAVDWLDLTEPAQAEHEVKQWLRAAKSTDYSVVPSERLGLYACWDVFSTKKLYSLLVEQRPAELAGIWETEIKLSAILHDMEMDGLLIDPLQCRKEKLKSLRRMIDAATTISQLANREFSNSVECIHDILCTQFGLPVLKTRIEKDEEGRDHDTGRPSFDKFALAMYAVHPDVLADEKLKSVVQAIKTYRTESTFNSLFSETFLDLHDERNLVHPSYNQIVRTGRMSARRPNSQQQNKRSKALILAPPGMAFWSCDYSQIEFRLIVHYTQDLDAIQAYRDNPDTDFHKWVADMLGVRRRIGKTLNFGMAYGAGKRKVTANLVVNPDIVEEIGKDVVRMVETGEITPERRRNVFADLCEQRASRSYEDYHERFPGIKRTSKLAAEVCRKRGYVYNAYGRRRHLPVKASRKAFNSIVQGCAMDIIKERMIAVSPRFNEKSRTMGLKLSGDVHDEVFGLIPKEAMLDPVVHEHLRVHFETPSVQFRVPITTGLGVSDRNWAEAAGDASRFKDGTVRELDTETLRSMQGEIAAGKLR